MVKLKTLSDTLYLQVMVAIAINVAFFESGEEAVTFYSTICMLGLCAWFRHKEDRATAEIYRISAKQSELLAALHKAIREQPDDVIRAINKSIKSP